MTLAELNTKRDALLSAIATGVLRVRVGEIETQYQSTAEMRSALSILNSEIAAQSSSSTGTRFSTTAFYR
jgi:hypothetical protein